MQYHKSLRLQKQEKRRLQDLPSNSAALSPFCMTLANNDGYSTSTRSSISGKSHQTSSCESISESVLSCDPSIHHRFKSDNFSVIRVLLQRMVSMNVRDLAVIPSVQKSGVTRQKIHRGLGTLTLSSFLYRITQTVSIGA